MKHAAKQTALLGLCTALALLMAYVELLIPPIVAAVPGVKIGLPNVIIVFILYRIGAKQATVVSLVRVALVTLLFGNAMAFAYSIAGAALSLLVMIGLRKLKLFSAVGVSVAGAVMHNVGQVLTAMLLLGTAELGYYLIVLSLTGTLAGVLIGICGALLIQKISDTKKY